ncbi:MAG TPA: hypothetical protein VKU00_07885, partial [Chthonomonadaceae bacterium]|nr:hypothetical protein [Chthonomonadaceae bacterium]
MLAPALGQSGSGSSGEGGSGSSGSGGGSGGSSGGPGQPPTPHNNWKLQASFSGYASSIVSDTTNCPYWASEVMIPSNFTMGISTSGTSIDPLGGQFPATYSGGMSVAFSALAERVQSILNGTTYQSLSSGTLTITLTWQPKNNDMQANPPPHQIDICYRRFVSAGGIAMAQGQGQNAIGQASGTISGFGQSAAVNLPISPGYDSDSVSNADHDFITVPLQVNPTTGVATQQFQLQWKLYAYADAALGGGQAAAQAQVDLGVDFCVAGFDTGRFGPRHRGRNGGSGDGATDPTYTRWIPLSFSPQVSSQPFRFQPGALPPPWGNIYGVYGMTLRQEPSTPNLDLDGLAQLYRPNQGGGAMGSFNNAGPPFTAIPSGFIPMYCLTDADGSRLLWDAQWNPNEDVHSLLISSPTTFQLTNAGPPGALGSVGHYTYTFQVVTTNPLFARLISIQDNLNTTGAPAVNQQTLTWNDGGDPFLTVTDFSSGGMGIPGRQLLFHAGAGGYLSAVDAPTNDLSASFTHTTTAFDAGGHLTSVNVYAGDSNTLLHSDQFSYGGPTGDSLTSVRHGVSVTSYTWSADALNPDPFGNPIPRLSSITAGSGSDTSSSDDGTSIAGTYTFTWGPSQVGYNDWGAEVRTNTFTDALGHLYTDLFTLSNEVSGAINGDTYTGPDYTGAPPHSNVVQVSYNPDIANPGVIQLTDPFAMLWEWDFNPQTGRLVEMKNPLESNWTWGWSADAKELTSLTDPTGISVNYHYQENNNPPHRLTSVTDNGGATQLQIDYNRFGQPTIFTNPASVS